MVALATACSFGAIDSRLKIMRFGIQLNLFLHVILISKTAAMGELKIVIWPTISFCMGLICCIGIGWE